MIGAAIHLMSVDNGCASFDEMGLSRGLTNARKLGSPSQIANSVPMDLSERGLASGQCICGKQESAAGLGCRDTLMYQIKLKTGLYPCDDTLTAPTEVRR
ncbi:MAG: hypothetical protein CMM01_26200 [Rhodopirellula sp.]|nr:hypothetical protein [Rhodopirellula sp.]